MKFFFYIVLLFPCLLTSQNFKLTDSVFHKNDMLRSYQVIFELGKATILSKSELYLDSVAKFLLKHKQLQVEVSCHSDSRVSQISSSCLTCKRAKSIADYLVTKGVESDRILSKGYGFAKLLIQDSIINKTNDSLLIEKLHQKNRRTEFRILMTNVNNKRRDELLDNPFDLQKFKKIKGQSNSGGAPKNTYYFKPVTKGFYYRFMMFKPMAGYIGEIPSNDIHYEGGLTVITYKPFGKYRSSYFDPTETLIEVVAIMNDQDLPELAFVGLDTVDIKKKLGDDFIRKENCFIYYKDKNVLVLKIKGKKVEWLKYTRLNYIINKDNIVPDLLTN
jgi:hypothetical protein